MRTKISLAFFVAGMLALGALILASAHPVIYAFRESGNPTGDVSWAIFNPFRDRAPEQSSEFILKSLQSGLAKDVFGKLTHLKPSYVHYFAKKEAEYPITAWKLISREDTKNSVRLLYTAVRGGSNGVASPIWITVQSNQGDWEPINFEAWY